MMHTCNLTRINPCAPSQISCLRRLSVYIYPSMTNQPSFKLWRLLMYIQVRIVNSHVWCACLCLYPSAPSQLVFEANVRLYIPKCTYCSVVNSHIFGYCPCLYPRAPSQLSQIYDYPYLPEISLANSRILGDCPCKTQVLALSTLVVVAIVQICQVRLVKEYFYV